MKHSERLLVAVSPPSQPKLRALLAHWEADFFDSYPDAAAALGRKQYGAAIVGLHFGESRMFDFVREIKARQPLARVVCVRGTANQLDSRPENLRPALEVLGAEGPIDLSGTPEAESGVLDELLSKSLS